MPSSLIIVALVVAFGFVSNDYVDLEVDRLNRPERPLPAAACGMRRAGHCSGTLLHASHLGRTAG